MHRTARVARLVVATAISLSLITISFAEQSQANDSTFTFFCPQKTFRFGSAHGTDCWGWVAPDGTNYAMMGTNGSVRIVNTSTMLLVASIAMPGDDCFGSNWSDFKTYRNYLYCVSECSGVNQGLTVIDLQYLPDSVHYVGSFDVGPFGGHSCHNISIDTITGYAYLEGDLGFFDDESIYLYSLANPENPVYLGGFGPNGGIHDLMVRNDTAYVAGSNGFQVWDMLNKFDPFWPVLISTVIPPSNGYFHNIWPSDDGSIFATTEETRNRTVKFWDKSDPSNIQLVGEYLAPGNLAHNVHLQGDRAFISHYESGVAILDISDPSNPQEIYRLDTYPASESSGFNGCWGVYPHTTNGQIYASNMDGWFYILEEEVFTVADTIFAEHVVAATGSSVRVDISVVNNRPIRRLNIPLVWSGGFSMTLDSVSNVGLRSSGFDEVLRKGYNEAASTAAYVLSTSDESGASDIQIGSGPVLSVYFSIPYEEIGTVNYVRFEPYVGISTYQAEFETPCITYSVDTLSGSVSLSDPCCVGVRGNIDFDPQDMINITDLTHLIGYLFSGGTPPLCVEESNVDGLGNNLPDIADLTNLVAYMFSDGPDPANCPGF